MVELTDRLMNEAFYSCRKAGRNLSKAVDLIRNERPAGPYVYRAVELFGSAINKAAASRALFDGHYWDILNHLGKLSDSLYSSGFVKESALAKYIAKQLYNRS